MGYTGRLAWCLCTLHSEGVPGKRAGISVKPGEARPLREMVDYVQSNSTPEEPVAVMRYVPIVNFRAEWAESRIVSPAISLNGQP